MQGYKQLEQEFSKFTGKDYAVALNSGTSALHLALLALGVGKDDEVIVPDFTFVACAFAVSYCGAKPIFVPVKDDFTIDETKIERRLTTKTKVIMPVHIYGHKCNMEAILKIANKYDIKVLEDCSEMHEVKLSDSDVAIYSLQESKQIHCEEGGMLVTNDKKIYDEVNMLKTFYHDGDYNHKKLSFNYRMPESQAKLALKSLKQFNGKSWVKEIGDGFIILQSGVKKPFFKLMSSLKIKW